MRSTRKVGIATTVAAMVVLAACGVRAGGSPDDHRMAKLPAGTNGLQKATFAMGCFWSAESAFEGLPGVKTVTSGFTGGTTKNPSYEQVSYGNTHHAEAIEVLFDPRQVSYAELLDLFWHNIDPTQKNGQFCDRGEQYRTAIFTHDESQRRLAEATKRKIESNPRRFSGRIVTEIAPAGAFYPAEEYHQDFYRKQPEHYGRYREGCGRDRRLIELWGKPGRTASHTAGTS